MLSIVKPYLLIYGFTFLHLTYVMLIYFFTSYLLKPYLRF